MRIIKKLFYSVAIVTIFTSAERLLGFLYRIILSRYVGAEGLGIYSIAISVFAVLITLTTSGLPVTVSRYISKYRAEHDEKSELQIVSAGILLAVLISLPIFLIFFIFKDQLGFLFSDSRSLKIFTILLPAIVFSAIYSVIRGVFWGRKQFFKYSFVEFIEEISMIIIGLILVTQMTNAYQGAIKASYALCFSYIISFALAVTMFFFKGYKFANPSKMLRPIFLSALPITSTRTLASLLNSAIAILLPLMLVKTGLTKTEALELFGISYGMAIPLLFMPLTLIGAIALVLVPEISSNFAKKEFTTLSSQVEKSIKISIFCACMIIPIFMALGESIGSLIYKSSLSGKYLSFSALLMLPLSVSQITTSLLNSLSKEKITFRNFLIGAVITLLCILFLPKYIGIYALAVGMIIDATLDTFLNLRALKKIENVNFRYFNFLVMAIIFLIPTLFLTSNIYNLLLNYFGVLSALTLSMICSVLFNFVLYLVFDLVKITNFLKVKRISKKHV